MLLPTVSGLVIRLGTSLRPMIRFVLLSVAGFLTWAVHPDRSAFYSCCWASPAESFSGSSSAGLTTMLCCLKFETHPPNLKDLIVVYPAGTGWPIYRFRCVINNYACLLTHFTNTSKSVILLPTVSRPVYLGVTHPSKTRDQLSFFFYSS